MKNKAFCSHEVQFATTSSSSIAYKSETTNVAVHAYKEIFIHSLTTYKEFVRALTLRIYIPVIIRNGLSQGQRKTLRRVLYTLHREGRNRRAQRARGARILSLVP